MCVVLRHAGLSFAHICESTAMQLDATHPPGRSVRSSLLVTMRPLAVEAPTMSMPTASVVGLAQMLSRRVESLCGLR